MLNRVNHQVLKFKKSGIRKFAEAAAKMEGVVSLTIGEPEFDTEVVIKDAAKKHWMIIIHIILLAKV